MFRPYACNAMCVCVFVIEYLQRSSVLSSRGDVTQPPRGREIISNIDSVIGEEPTGTPG